MRALAVAAAVGSTALFIAGAWTVDGGEAAFLFAFLLYALVGCFIAFHRPTHLVAWLLVAVGSTIVLSSALDGFAQSVASGDAAAWARWGQGWAWMIGWSLGTTVLLLVLPDGRYPSPRWTWVGRGALAVAGLSTLVGALRPGPIGDDLPVDNPVGLDGLGAMLEALDSVLVVLLNACLLAGLAALVIRWRRADESGRRMLGWLLLGVLLALCGVGVGAALQLAGVPESVAVWVVALGLAMPPLGIAVAVLRERLFDIELVVSRTVVYMLFSVLLLGTYAGALVVASFWFQDQADVAVSLLATALVVAALGAVRERLQRRVEKALFGERSRPYEVLAKLGDIAQRHVDGAAVIADLVAELRRTLRLSYVAVVRPKADLVAAGQRPDDVESYPLLYAGRELGRLEVARRGSSGFQPAERTLLESAASRVALSVWASQLDSDLQMARKSLVRGREQERGRIRRDLHDGVGPVLAAATLQVDSLRRRLDEADLAGQALADRVKEQLQQAVADVRALLEDLRPPGLDTGLAAALAEQAVRLSDVGISTELQVDNLPALEPAAEVAAYRVACEAMTNVVRHSGARNCRVTLRCVDQALQLEVEDDGRGLPSLRTAGVGMQSMEDRTAELGGSVTFSTASRGGLAVRARIPLGES